MTIDFGAALRPPAVEPEIVEETTAQPPAPVEMDAEGVRRALAEYNIDMLAMHAGAKELVVNSTESKARAVSTAARARKLEKAVEAVRKAHVKPHNDHVKTINRLCKVYSDLFNEVTRELTNKIGAYTRVEEVRRREAERIAQEAVQAAMAEQMPEGETAPEIQVVMAKSAKVTRTEDGSAHTRAVWKWREADPLKIPRDCLMTDVAKINKLVAAGVREIEGIEIYEEKQTIIRT